MQRKDLIYAAQLCGRRAFSDIHGKAVTLTDGHDCIDHAGCCCGSLLDFIIGGLVEMQAAVNI